MTGLVLAHQVPGPDEFVAFVVMFAVAVLFLYAMTMALIALSVRLVNSDEIGHVGYLAVELGRFPVQLYRNPVQTVLTVLPIAPLLARAIREVFEDGSVTSLFDGMS